MMRDFSRQGFLGRDSMAIFATVRAGVVGLSGGGSHIVQQLAHLGVKKYALADHDRASISNLNRLVGATAHDVASEVLKVEIARRTILSVNPDAAVEIISSRWQEAPAKLRSCNVIFGCVDSYGEREQLERFSRRFLIPYIDIGMDVIEYEDELRIVGQVVQSFPGSHCLRCMNIVNEFKLKREAELYGTAGIAPQVVWPNGVLASTAISLFVRLFTSWGPKTETVYLEYNGNESRLIDSPRLPFILREACMHYRLEVGDPLFVVKSTAEG